MDILIYIAFLGFFIATTGTLFRIAPVAKTNIVKERDKAVKNVKKKFGKRKRMDSAMIDGIYGVMEPSKKYESRVYIALTFMKLCLILGIILTVCGITFSHIGFPASIISLIDLGVFSLCLPLGFSLSTWIVLFVRL